MPEEMRPIRLEPQQTNFDIPPSDSQSQSLEVRNAQPTDMTKINLSSFKPGVLKDTLLLPKTSLPIRPVHLNRRLLVRSTDDLYQWQSTTLPKENTFILHDGPPYANGSLHMGHALNKILKDIISRYQILSGRRISYIPGWDCHGLPIELKALQSLNLDKSRETPKLKKSKKSDASDAAAATAAAAERGKFMDPVEVRKLAAKLANETIKEQKAGFKSWGVMGDWENAYKTLERDYEIEQLSIFREMLRKGLIYRRFKPVYWSPSSGTALAEAELEYDEKHASKAAFVKFPIKEFSGSGLGEKFSSGLSATIWTTTPWTIPANKAIVVNPSLEYSVLETEEHGHLLAASSRVEALREFVQGTVEVVKEGILGEELLGLKYVHPLLKENAPLQPVLSADFVTSDSGTGLVHCAPGHGMEDYLVCQKHGIKPFSPVDNNGLFTEDAIPFGSDLLGMKVLYEGTKKVLALLTESNALLAVQDKYVHKYPYDWRTKLPVIVRATAQWFADVDGIKAPAIESLKNVKFVPETGRSRLISFVQGRSEWCISRQRAWGTPIPALYDAETGEPLLTEESVDHIINVLKERGTNAWWGDEVDNIAWVSKALRGGDRKWVRGKETMDVWFDSGTSWATLKQRIGEREDGKPLADLYLEGTDQHRGWFQSSLLTSIATSGKSPFGMVLTHGFCMDEKGKKMSKSLGNVVAPEDVIEGKIPKAKREDRKGGVNTLRLWVAYCDYTKDVIVGDKVLNHVNECLRKNRVTARFLLGNLEGWDGKEVEYDQMTKVDQYALAQLYQVNKATEDAYRNMQFNKVVNAITTYTSLDLSAFYLDVIKDRIYSDPAESLSRRSAQTVMYYILRNYLSMLAPIVPLLTEEIWNHAPAAVTKEVISPSRLGWYTPEEKWNDATIIKDFGHLGIVHSVVKANIEKARGVSELKVNLESSVVLVTQERSEARLLLNKYVDELANLFIVSEVALETEVPRLESWSYVETVSLLGDECRVIVRPAKGHKCKRCWVYTAEEENGICNRCEGTLNSYPKEKFENLLKSGFRSGSSGANQ